MKSDSESRPVVLSVIIPFFNEEENVSSVCEEVREVLERGFAEPWEIVMVDDGSKDRTPEMIDALAENHRGLRAIHLIPNSGQSAAFEAGIRAARGSVLATMDGDGQNDPADLMHLLREKRRRRVNMMCGIRRKRADNLVRRMSSRIANNLRSRVLDDGITDVGCSIRVFDAHCVERVRFFRNAHRFFPALVRMQGGSIAETPVNHRPRSKGTSKYGGGIRSRLFVGIFDLLGVLWLKRRNLRYRVREHRAEGSSAP